LLGSQGPKKGKEIWESWKRAWDLWNNHYIEGRVDPVWVKEEYEKSKKEYEEEMKERMEWKRKLRGREPGRHDCDPPLKVKRPDQVTKCSKSSAGFFAMKDLPEYYQPEIPPVGTHVRDWEEDMIRNTVWRPRQAGGTVAKIELDSDIGRCFRNSNLQVDGGVDCGRSPYPVHSTLYLVVQLLAKKI
jgi:hypothetical protein